GLVVVPALHAHADAAAAAHASRRRAGLAALGRLGRRAGLYAGHGRGRSPYLPRRHPDARQNPENGRPGALGRAGLMEPLGTAPVCAGALLSYLLLMGTLGQIMGSR